jgi:aminoglycoside phosphotransferase (APT) family kinase protein
VERRGSGKLRGQVTDPLRHRPPEHALRWAAESVGPGSHVTSVRRLTEGGWHANHALTVVDRGGRCQRLVLRRWARPGWWIDDPDFTPEREARVLTLLSDTPVPAPLVVAADPEAACCDVPALVLTRLPGRTVGLPGDMDRFLAQLAEALTEIHAVDGRARELIPAYRSYYDPRSATAPAWSRRRRLWERAIEAATEPPPDGRRCLIHRDYHPQNTLWSRERLTGIVDWTSASWGPAAVDTGHMRWNLALSYGLDAADEFLRRHRSLRSDTLDDQRYWDIVTVLDLVPEIEPGAWAAFDLARLERYLESVLSGYSPRRRSARPSGSSRRDR